MCNGNSENSRGVFIPHSQCVYFAELIEIHNFRDRDFQIVESSLLIEETNQPISKPPPPPRYLFTIRAFLISCVESAIPFFMQRHAFAANINLTSLEAVRPK